MELINQTGVPTELLVSDHGTTASGAKKRAGVLVAKATFEVRADGSLDLVTDDPHPVLRGEEQTALGILPRDVGAPGQQGFEVLALAAAYAPTSTPVHERTVTMWVDQRRDDLRVFGDREWLEVDDRVAMTSPKPFSRMPLTWERAYGGTAQVWVDEHTQIPISHPYNALGRGFDAQPLAEGLCQQLRSPASFPRVEHERVLPNIERTGELIVTPDDDPTPCGWSPMPFEIGLPMKPAVDASLAARESEAREAALDAAPPGLRFATPRWQLPEAPPPLASIGLAGCRPHDKAFAFRWPRLAVFADYVLDGRSGARELRPSMLVLLPEEERFTVTYRDAFAFLVEEAGRERSMRLRLEE